MTENELLRELAQELNFKPIQKDEITARMLAMELGIEINNARNLLESRVKAGKLSKRKARTSEGYQTYAYKKIDT
jgi:predicted transcriptional regulator